MAQEAEATKADAPKTDAEPTTDDKAEAPKSEDKDSPSTFPREYVESLRSEAAANRKRAAEAESRVEEFENQNKSELEKAQTKATKAEQKAAEAETKLLVYTIAAEKKVPAEAVGFLKGNTREDLEASADQLLTLVKSSDNNDKTDFDGGAREPAPESKTPEQAHNDLILRMIGAAREE